MPHHLIKLEIDGLDLLHWSALYTLKDRFGVTITAMKNRLLGLGLIFVSPEGKIFQSREEYEGNKFMI